MDRVEKEMADFKALDARDLALGMETKRTKKKFNPLKFFASPSIASRFPLHVRLAKSFFGSLLHEATSERSFSTCGQKLGDLRKRTDKKVICAQVRVSTGESIERIAPAEVMRFYKTSSGRKRKSLGNGGTNGDGLAILSDSDDDEEGEQQPYLPAGLPPPPLLDQMSDED